MHWYISENRYPRHSEAENLISIWTSISAVEIAREYLPAAAWSKILNAPALVISARIKHHLQKTSN